MGALVVWLFSLAWTWMLPSGDTEVVLVEKENPYETIHFSLSLEEGGETHKALLL